MLLCDARVPFTAFCNNGTLFRVPNGGAVDVHLAHHRDRAHDGCSGARSECELLCANVWALFVALYKAPARGHFTLREAGEMRACGTRLVAKQDATFRTKSEPRFA